MIFIVRLLLSTISATSMDSILIFAMFSFPFVVVVIVVLRCLIYVYKNTLLIENGFHLFWSFWIWWWMMIMCVHDMCLHYEFSNQISRDILFSSIFFLLFNEKKIMKRENVKRQEQRICFKNENKLGEWAEINWWLKWWNGENQTDKVR